MKHTAGQLVIRSFGIGLLAMATGSVGGCGAPIRAQDDLVVSEPIDNARGLVELDGVSYEDAFVAARAVLAEFRFGINRVDAARGVLTSYPKRSAGLASPWDGEQSSIGQEFEDLTNQQERTIHIEFERGEQADADADANANADTGRVVARVRVIVNRVHRPNWRVDTQSILLSTHARSRDAMGNLERSEFREPIGQDTALADRLARAIVERLGA